MKQNQIMYAVVSRRNPNSINSIHLSKWHADNDCGKLSKVIRVGVFFDKEMKVVTVRNHEYQKLEISKMYEK
jgi:hypothetical protein